MFNRKFSSNIRRRKRMVISSLILLVVFLTIGYSVFTTNLGINGTLNISKYDRTLYGVLKKAAKVGTYAKEYTNNHQDSMAEVGNEKIYYWWANNDTNGTTITNMNNVIFANHCWQMIRTTDTGGVKMIYNGEAVGGKCLNTRGKHVGYDSASTIYLSSTYAYGNDYTYDAENNLFTLSGETESGTIGQGKYTCRSTSLTCNTLYLVDKLVSGSTYSAIKITGDSNYSQLGNLQFNQNYNSLAYVGYMYNSENPIEIKSQIYYINDSNIELNTSYYYSDSIDYGNMVTNQYTLNNPQLISSLSDYNNLVNKYIMASGTSTNAWYILGVNGTNLYAKRLVGGDLNVSMVIGNSYTNNGDNTYTINSPTQVSYTDWYNGSYENYKNKYVCDGTSITCSNIKHITESTSNAGYYYWGIEHNYKYGEKITYNNGTYTLTGDIKNIWDLPNASNQTVLSTHHYTCLDGNISCSAVKYISYYYNPNIYYYQLNGDNDISNAINNILSADNVNSKNSTIKTGIDAWYKKYMTNYTSNLEDIIFCNNRNINNLGSWDPNGGSVSSELLFNNNDTNLNCTNITDKFAIANEKANLSFPVGLISIQEGRLLTNTNILKSSGSYWTLSPSYIFIDRSYNSIINDNNSSSRVSYSLGVRPVISLKPGTEYTSGSGSMSDPYIVEVPMGTLTIRYIDENGAEIHEPFEVQLPKGSSFNYVNPTISGYEPDTPNATGTINGSYQTKVVVYHDTSTPIID